MSNASTKENKTVNAGMRPEAVAEIESTVATPVVAGVTPDKNLTTFVASGISAYAGVPTNREHKIGDVVVPAGTYFYAVKRNQTATILRGKFERGIAGIDPSKVYDVPIDLFTLESSGGKTPRAARTSVSHGAQYDAYILTARAILKKNDSDQFVNMDASHFQEYVESFAALVAHLSPIITAAEDLKDPAVAQAVDDLLSCKSHQHIIAAELRKLNVI